MNCPDNNDPCSLYDNCGCINPNTFGCTSYQGEALENIGAVNGEDGDSILSKIDSKIQGIQENKGKVLIDSGDTCPDYLFDKIQEGLNISFSMTGTGCNRKLVINAVDGGTPIDVNAKVSAADTTSDYLYNKITVGNFITKVITSPAGNEKLRLDLNPASLISADSGNQITIGVDGKLKTGYSAPDGSETKIIAGSGIIISGSGTSIDQYIISTNPSIQAARSCFDGVWTDITLVASGNANVVYQSGQPQYRIRFDGTIEFRGNITYTVSFGAYSTGSRKYTVPMGTLGITCLTVGEQAGTADLKVANYIDAPQASVDQITQLYGYIIRKSAQNMILEFQSSFTNTTSRTIVVSFDGAVSHPII